MFYQKRPALTSPHKLITARQDAQSSHLCNTPHTAISGDVAIRSIAISSTEYINGILYSNLLLSQSSNVTYIILIVNLLSTYQINGFYEKRSYYCYLI